MKDLKIGLEIHVQLNTKSKLFCSCSTNDAPPNEHLCPTCLGMPGAKPLLNKEVITKAIQIALALHATPQEKMIFSRKTYFYPDLAKNYQITQYESPAATQGFLEVEKKRITIDRIQIEEDPASIHHRKDHTLLDYNRSGIPLVEIVTAPDFTSLEQVLTFISELTSILDYLDMYDPSKFSLRTDVNVNITGHPRVEVKNLNGTKVIEKSIIAEIKRQEQAVRSKKPLQQQTMHYDPTTEKTFASRVKETEEDYGYIYDPDLPIITLKKRDIEKIKKELPELRKDKISRFIKQHALPRSEAYVICLEKATANLYESLVKFVDTTLLKHWIMGPLRKVLNYNHKKFSETGITKEQAKTLLNLIHKKVITPRISELVLREMVVKPDSPLNILKKMKVDSTAKDGLEKTISTVLQECKAEVSRYKKGETKLFHYLVGQVMKKTKGSVDPQRIHKELKEKI